MTKQEYVRSLPLDVSTGDVVRRAAAAGLIITPHYIQTIRSTMRRTGRAHARAAHVAAVPPAAAPAAPPAATPTPTEAQLITLALRLGRRRVESVLTATWERWSA